MRGALAVSTASSVTSAGCACASAAGASLVASGSWRMRSADTPGRRADHRRTVSCCGSRAAGPPPCLPR
eukprot:943224-Lingulodinium_polyedra.AAC.1